MKNRKVKSNRAQADYFELLVCQYICHLYNITFSYSRDLAELSNKVLSLPSGMARLKLQNNNFIKIQPKIKEILDFEIGQKGKVINVIWVGRSLLIETTSDVDAEHISSQKTRFSIKSIANTGTGTLKNLGARQIKKYLGIDFSNNYEQMWEELRKYLSDSTSSQDQIKKRVQKSQKLLKWATENGKKYQIVLNELCINGFNSLFLNKKINFLNFITDCNDDDLYVIIVNSTEVIIYKPVEKNLKLIKNIEVKKDKMTDVGYTIFVDNKPTFRVQTNNTNGIGISAFCQRIFWV
jgi:hypothetical protein